MLSIREEICMKVIWFRIKFIRDHGIHLVSPCLVYSCQVTGPLTIFKFLRLMNADIIALDLIHRLDLQ